jgi:hypothetical protein
MGTSLDVRPSVAPGQDSVKMFRGLRKEISMILPRVAAIVSMCGILEPMAGFADTITFQTTAFSQGFSIALPDRFQPGYEDLTDGGYILELVPKGERVEDWSELFTLTALKGQTGAGRAYADSILDGFAQACPGSFSHAELEPPKIEGAEVAALIYASCGDLGDYSESVVFLTVNGLDDAYSVQLAERSMPQAVPIAFDAGYWAERVDLLAGAQFIGP